MRRNTADAYCALPTGDVVKSAVGSGRGTMQIGVMGLGRMGANIVRRLTRHGHACVVYDRDPEPGRALTAEGAVAAIGPADLVKALVAPRVVWVMLPSG